MIPCKIDFTNLSARLAETGVGKQTLYGELAFQFARDIGITDSQTSDDTDVAFSNGRFCFCSGEPRFATAAETGPAANFLAAPNPLDAAGLAKVAGNFAVLVVDIPKRKAVLATDIFAITPACIVQTDVGFAVAGRADQLAGASIDLQALFDYLYHHVIPAPRTIFAGVARLRASHCAVFEPGRMSVAAYWKPAFSENQRRPLNDLRAEFLDLLRQSTRDALGTGVHGCFLSGGTDSSTVAGMIGEVTGKPASTFSIGFDAAGYDEMEYARIAARHFGTDHHEYYVTPADLVRSIPKVAASFDQPFGNSSAVPGYYCAKMARDAGIEHLLAGDGGDELFGGNTRYAKQSVFGYYSAIPAALREGLIEPAISALPFLANIPLVKKGVSYVQQARVPMPDRLETYNLLQRIGLSEILTPEFLGLVDCAAPQKSQRAVYAEAKAASLVNRMLAYDWKYTLADNDLPKVLGGTSLAGVDVRFPLLDRRLVEFSLRLEPELKLKGLKLRWFFKEALRGFLPDEIIAKKKHGFGLPFGVWAVRDQGLKNLLADSMGSLSTRGLVNPGFLQGMIDDLLPQHPGYYGEIVWILMMLEQWLRAKAPEWRLQG